MTLNIQVRPTGPTGARIMIVGDCPGEQEILRGEPFVGAAGVELTRMLHDAGIMRSECFITNVARSRPFANDIENWICTTKKDTTTRSLDPDWSWVADKFVHREISDGIDLLRREIELVKPNVIIALGNLAFWALTSRWGIGDWRGSVLPCGLVPGCKVVPSYPPSSVLRQWAWRAVMVNDLKRAERESKSAELVRPDYSFIIRPDFSTAAAVLRHHITLADAVPLRLAVDIETRAGHIACIGWAWSRTQAICIPLMCIERLEGYWHEEEEVQLMFLMQQLFTHPNVRVEGQNFLYDSQYFWRHLRYKPRLVMDTMLAQHVCWAGQPKALDYQASLYCEHYAFWKNDGKEWSTKGMGEEQLWSYNCEDCVRTFEVAETHARNIEVLGLSEVNDFQHTMFWLVLDTVIRGVRFDAKHRSAFALMLSDEIAAREQWFIDVLGHPLKPRSGPQMKKLFYEDLNLPVQRNRKTGAPSLDDESLNKLAAKEPLILPIVRKISEYRSLGVFLSTFVNAPLDRDNRMRCSYNVAGTETFRLSSSENAFGSGTNLQNIPKGGDTGGGLELPNVRSLFLPDPGMTIFDTDLSSADLRVVVWESDETEMKRMLNDGLDPYTEVAKEFYKDKTITKKDPRRQKFKSFCHGTNYLGSARGLAMRLGISVAESERTQAWYFNRFPRIRDRQEYMKDQLRKHRFVQNGFGYRRYYFDRIDDDVYRQAAAWIPQSTVAVYINHIWARFVINIPEIEILLQVHDSVVGQFPSHLRDRIVKQMFDEAQQVVIPYADPLCIPLGAKFSTNNWGECE